MGRALVLALGSVLIASTAAAQVEVVEEGDATETQVVERGYVRGEGRGVQYGAHLVSPVYLSSVTPAAGRDVRVGAGVGLLARIGWEFPSGFTVEAFGGLAANGVDTLEHDDMSNVLMRAEIGAGFRYMFFNETAFVPFVQLGASLRWHWFDYLDFANSVQAANGDPTAALHAAVGFQIELTPYFGIEAGCMVDYTLWGKTFAEPGFVSLMPFVGVTLYVYDETGN